MVWRIRLKDRVLEWLFASYTLVFGLWLAAPWDALNPVSLARLLSYAPEDWWAFGFTSIGAGHCIALIINGAAWWTPYARAAAASLNFASYGLLVIGFVKAAPGSSGVPTYGYLVLGGLMVVIFRAMKDVFALRQRRLAH